MTIDETKTCIYCSKKVKTTVDHVPPQSFFPKPRPSNLITVPACLLCNQDAGKDEEYFLATFMFSNAGVSEAGKRLWSEKLHRMYEKNIGLRRKIADNLKPLEVFTPAGIYLGNRLGITTDEQRMSAVVGKIVKGLYYFEFNEALPQSAKIDCFFLQKQEQFEEAKMKLKYLRQGSRGWKGIFEYKFNRVPEDTIISMWLLLFYNFATFMVITYK